MEENKILEIFLKTNALLRGHFLLTSGRHSDQYFQCAKVLQYPEHTEFICSKITGYFKNHEIDTVISPAIGGIVVGQEVARQLNKRFIFTERENGKMTLRRGFTIEKGERVLICEDVVTTGGSVFEVIENAKENGAEIVGVGMIVDRSNGKVDFGVPQISTFQTEVISYSHDECPLCKENIPVVKPGSRKIK
ncbi:MAG: orotate phosphoribosyltransferase [Melioribacteraceae bacterium]|nr:orotate phosphoribosyltransferase [Melioribacteraceae bacterium]MCF8352848.1 orotate phosphoribosyltransferase [Melioribacteraceae bacterium]MCF8417365.1 orotate phosphoribosyltransferase [Melioribacteraceae bacterium]